MNKVVIVTGTNSGLGNSDHLRTSGDEHQRRFGKPPYSEMVDAATAELGA